MIWYSVLSNANKIWNWIMFVGYVSMCNLFNYVLCRDSIFSSFETIIYKYKSNFSKKWQFRLYIPIITPKTTILHEYNILSVFRFIWINLSRKKCLYLLFYNLASTLNYYILWYWYILTLYRKYLFNVNFPDPTFFCKTLFYFPEEF